MEYTKGGCWRLEIDGGRGTGYTKGGIYAGRRNRYVVAYTLYNSLLCCE